MRMRYLVRALSALLVLAMTATACGSDNQTDATDNAAAQDQEAGTDGDNKNDGQDGDGHKSDGDESGGHGEHAHGEAVAVDDLAATPSLTLDVLKDPKGGWNINAVPTNHALSPQSASTEHAPGEGHMHLYVDGEKITRLYGEWYHLADLAPGDHEIRVELSANSHAPLTLGGDIIDQTKTVTQDAVSTGHGHNDAEPHVVSGEGLIPGVSIQAFEDPKSGWNLNMVPSEFEIAPWSASTEFVEGEGHMHLYVDGQKITRIYSEWFHLADLTNGDHEIRVELSGNDHQPLSYDGELVDATLTITQVDGLVAPSEAAATADQTLTVAATDGTVSGDTGRQEVEAGSTVALIVSSTTADDVHVHGYDLFQRVTPDADAVFVFTADIPGIFEVELEGSGELLVELQVS